MIKLSLIQYLWTWNFGVAVVWEVRSHISTPKAYSPKTKTLGYPHDLQDVFLNFMPISKHQKINYKSAPNLILLFWTMDLRTKISIKCWFSRIFSYVNDLNFSFNIFLLNRSITI